MVDSLYVYFSQSQRLSSTVAKGGRVTGKKPVKRPDTPDKSANRKTIPLVHVPNDEELLEEEMRDIFKEDQVTHRQGSSEPEKD
jgi:hypothetical protein